MIINRVRGLNMLQGLFLCTVTLLLFWVWIFFLTYVRMQSHIALDRYCIYSLLVAGAFFYEMARSVRSKTNLLQMSFIKCHQVALRQTLTVIGVLVLFLVAAKDATMSRIFLFTFLPILYFVLIFSNKVLPRFLAAFLFRGGDRQQKSILMGSSVSAGKLETWLQRKVDYGLETVGLITEHEDAPWGGRLPILGRPSEVERVLKETEASQLIVLELPMELQEVTRLGELCDRLGVRLLLVNDLEEKLRCSISFIEDDGFHFLGLRKEPLECPWNRCTKRVLDIMIALPIVFFMLPPVTFVVWIFQRFQSPGPLFYGQRRTGLQKREFTIYKFRTMHLNDNEAQQASPNDPRIYRAGKWLRKLNIDELPQFINVLQGHMSVVGPRPHLVAHDSLFGEIATYYRVRSFIKPGITGLAQVRGLRGETRREVDLIDRIQSDVYYLENWSFFLDSLIIVRTAWQMVWPKVTAY